MLEVLRRVIQEVNGARNLDAALSTMVRRIRKAMQTDVCSFIFTIKNWSRWF